MRTTVSAITRVAVDAIRCLVDSDVIGSNRTSVLLAALLGIDALVIVSGVRSVALPTAPLRPQQQLGPIPAALTAGTETTVSRDPE